MQQFFDWRFDVSGMTPAQLRAVITALTERVRVLSSGPAAYMHGSAALDEAGMLREVAARLERALPENRPLPNQTIV